MALPRMQPLLRDIAIVLLATQVGGRLNKALPSLIEDAPITMVYRRRLEARLPTLCVLLLGVNQSLLPLLFELLHECLLLLCEGPAFLLFELLHAFIGGPWSLEITLACLSEFLALSLHLSPPRFLRHLWLLQVPVLANEHLSSDASSICWVQSHTCVVKLYTLLIEPCKV